MMPTGGGWTESLLSASHEIPQERSLLCTHRSSTHNYALKIAIRSGFPSGAMGYGPVMLGDFFVINE